MAAPSDPLSHPLQHQHSTHNNIINANSNPNHTSNPWGTWEELLLGSAVLKHGADNWALVAEELQSRARASFLFTPEACRAGYHAIQLRFGAAAGREGGSTQWYEELRRLRVAHLKRELEQYDSSIGSLECKISRLLSEAKAQGSNAEPGGSDSIEAPCELNLRGVAADVPIAWDSKKPCSDMVLAFEEAHADRTTDREDGSMGVSHATTSETPLHHTTPDTRVSTTLTGMGVALSRMKQSNGTGKRVHHEATGSLLQHRDKSALYENGRIIPKEEEQPLSSSSTLYLSLSKSDTTSREQEKLSRDPNRSVNVKQEEDAFVSRSMKTPMRITPENTNHTATFDRLGDDHVDSAGMGHALPSLQPDASDKVDIALQRAVSAKLGVSPSLKSVNIDECKNLAQSPYADDDDNGRKSDESQSLCSPRLKSQHVKRRRSGDGSGPGFSRELYPHADVDDKRHVRKALGERGLAEAMCSLPVESADSTEGKGQRALAMKALNLDASTSRVKKEMLTCKEENDTLPGENTARNDKDHSRKLVITPMNSEKKTQSTSSIENSLHREIWGESVDVDKEIPTRKRRKLKGRVDWKHRATDTDNLKGTSNTTPRTTIKSESLSTSHEASESMQSPEGKEGPGMEAWNLSERLSGDSRFEKSEVGSYVDGNEDISPMSRRNRREPKVSGKLIPLLESLRTICAHRCGHFFRHNHEPEENDTYYRIVRAPIDLGLIRTKLEEGQYSGSMHFFRDLLLMVNNASVYYPRDSTECAAASGLRECIMKEMGHVFETEALVKQEGPSFRKRDSKQITGQGRKKGGLKLLSSMDRSSRDRDRALKQSDVSTSIESRRLSHQSFASRLGDGARVADKGIDGKRGVNTGMDIHKTVETSDCKKVTNSQATPEVSSSLKSGVIPLEKVNEVKERLGAAPGKEREIKEPGSSRSPMHTSRDVMLKDRSSEHASEKKAAFSNVGVTSKPSVLAPYKGKESANLKVKAAPNSTQQPVKRGVGRPPKHSQQQFLPKASDVLGMTNSTRKRSRR
ncbi:hypothetical protein L7F22_023879 [Adiantum nelumboides]|nr:hypothetical protein [Adiantum nelumboides]